MKREPGTSQTTAEAANATDTRGAESPCETEVASSSAAALTEALDRAITAYREACWTEKDSTAARASLERAIAAALKEARNADFAGASVPSGTGAMEAPMPTSGDVAGSRFRKRPVVINAVQWTGRNRAEIEHWMGRELGYTTSGNDEATLWIPTLEGGHVASRGDWIIRGVKGEFYPCKPDIFAATYEAVRDPVPPPAAGIAADATATPADEPPAKSDACSCAAALREARAEAIALAEAIYHHPGCGCAGLDFDRVREVVNRLVLGALTSPSPVRNPRTGKLAHAISCPATMGDDAECRCGLAAFLKETPR
jgi:hypothetical protein